jgi:hypothetical protein
MLLGGGNTPGAAQVVADSVANLFAKFRLGGGGAAAAAPALELSPLMGAAAGDSVVPGGGRWAPATFSV